MNKDLIVLPNISIRDAMKCLSQVGERCLIVADVSGKLLGTLSDGDVRRTILSGVNVGESIESYYFKKTTALVQGEYTLEQAQQLFLRHKFDLIPVLDKMGIVRDLLFLQSVLHQSREKPQQQLQVPVVIMAGGKGARMEPFTKVLPKPLIPIQDKTVIEHIIEQFNSVGCSEYFMIINYKGRILKAYFEELQPDYKMEFVEEQAPFGTAGSLSLLKGRFNCPFIVTNCDILVRTDFAELYEFHQKGKYDITLVASTKEFVIPYGTCELNSDGHLSHIIEKPRYDFLINTGLYVLNPEVLEHIPEKTFFHITHLIEKLKNQGKKIGVFPVNEEAWIDVGQWAEYQKAVERF